METRKSSDISLHIIALFVISLIYILNEEYLINSITFLLVDIFIIYFYYWQLSKVDERTKKFILSRKLWLKNIVMRTVIHTSPLLEFEIDAQLEIDSSIILGRSELGMKNSLILQDAIPPDMKEAENELTRLEERASFLIGATVFLPVLFGMMHIFRSVSLSVFLLELQIFIILGQLVTLSQNRAYNIDGWNKMYAEATNLRNDLISNGRQTMNKFSFVKNVNSNEIGLNLEFKKMNNAETTYAYAMNSISKLSRSSRAQAFDYFIKEVQDLPKKEQIMKTKWESYKSRILMISTIGMALSALFSSISQFDYSGLSDELLPIKSTIYLPYGLLFLSTTLSLLVSKIWLKNAELVRWGTIWVLIYYLMYSMINVII